MLLRGLWGIIESRGILSIEREGNQHCLFRENIPSTVCGMNRSGGETGGKNTMQMIRRAIDKQEGYHVQSP